MLARLIPRDEQFFDLFDQLTAHLTQTARMLAALFDDPQHVADHVRAIKAVEHKADVLTSTINQRIDKSFVTPIDREDIHMLASRLDDVIDLLGEIVGGGRYEDLLPHALTITLFGREVQLLDLPWLIHVKRAAGRPKDLEVVAELIALQEEIDRSGGEGALTAEW